MAPIHPYSVTKPFELWELNFISQLIKTPRGNEYLITSIHYSTSKAIAYPIRSRSVKVAVKSWKKSFAHSMEFYLKSIKSKYSEYIFHLHYYIPISWIYLILLKILPSSSAISMYDSKVFQRDNLHHHPYKNSG